MKTLTKYLKLAVGFIMVFGCTKDEGDDITVADTRTIED